MELPLCFLLPQWRKINKNKDLRWFKNLNYIEKSFDQM